MNSEHKFSLELCLKVFTNEKRGGLKVEMGLQIDIVAWSVSSKTYLYYVIYKNVPVFP